MSNIIKYLNTGKEFIKYDFGNKECRILVVGDYHGRSKDFSTVKGHVKNFEKQMLHLIELKNTMNLTGIIINGDLSDGGYQDDIIADSHKNLISLLGEGLDIFLLNIGNHFFIERDSNIELFLIQPSMNNPMKRPHFSAQPILKTPRGIVVNDSIQFTLFNYSLKDKKYIEALLPDTKYHIGIYHDEVVLPKTIRADLHLPVQVTSTYLKAIYANINEAVCSHIHKPFGLQFIDLDGKVIPIYIPGSGCITENSAIEIHKEVNWPLYIIKGQSISRETVTCSTGIENLTFLESSTKKREKLKDININFISEAVKELPTNNITFSRKTSLINYLRDKGYHDNELESVRLATIKALDESTELSLHLRKNKIKDEEFI